MAENARFAVMVPVDRVEAQFEVWAAKLDALVIRIDGAGGRIGDLHRHHVEGLKFDFLALQAAYRALSASPEQYQIRYGGDFARAWNDLAAAFDELMILNHIDGTP